MKIAEMPANEVARLEKLQSYQILDSQPEGEYDDFAKIASFICETPIALISLVDEDRQWFKSKVGIDADETPRDVAFCAHAILRDDIFVVENAKLDERFADNPLVVGGPKVVFYAGAPLRSPTGENIGTLCVIDTKAKKLNSSQSHALESLARQVVNLLELKKANQEATRTIAKTTTFLANMSHEIRTPLNGILGITELAIAEDRLGKKNELLGVVGNCGRQLKTIVDDVLDYLKFDSGEVSIKRKAVDLDKLLAGLVSLYAAAAEKKGLTLLSEKSLESPKVVWIDENRIRQILANFLDNAIKFSESGTVFLGIESNIDAEGNLKLQMSVEDQGIGLEDEEQKIVFDSFCQVDSSDTKEYGGTGLGLTICKKYIELMDGKLWVESSKGKGSKFCFEIPTRETDLDSVGGSSMVESMEFDLNILVVDDNEINQKIAQSFLKKLGCRVASANNGVEAIQAVQESKFDLVFMDCQMPVMDGYTASIEITKQNVKQGYGPKIIAMTASAMEGDREKCLASGMNDYITKPISKDSVANILSKYSKHKE